MRDTAQGLSEDIKAKLTEKLVDGLQPRTKRYDVDDEALRGLLLRVETGGTKTYYLKYRTVTGAQRMVKLGRTADLTLGEAREKGKRQRGEIAQGKDPAEERRKRRQSLTLAAFLDEVYDGGSPAIRAGEAPSANIFAGFTRNCWTSSLRTSVRPTSSASGRDTPKPARRARRTATRK